MKEIDDNLLTEFLEGKLDETANREIENWYDASEENRRHLETLYFVLFTGDRLRAAASVNTDQAFRALQRRIEVRRTKSRPQWRQIAARYAAILIAGVIVAGMYLYQNLPDDRRCTVSAERSDCSVTLPDGSVIRLTRSSQLNYPASFDDSNRKVHLIGEAFFEVSKRNGAPFTVSTVHNAEVVVRGTKFNLKAYDDCSDIETVLVEGAVDFHAAEHVVALHPGQKVSYNPTDNDLMLQTVNIEAELAARLRTFRHVALGQITGVIEKFYGIGINFRCESLKDIRFTGTLDFNKPIDHILEVLTLSTSTRFHRNGEKITIHK
ncbi:FecR domain-containing protein [Alistipes sp.]|uniref:FecR domain-containing protein n=1 Tax=Alistipes sp. TaxID=1872444 RepID=UPI0025BDB6EB|nr:FecR domain-containing protein [Alistipes sp.]